MLTVVKELARIIWRKVHEVTEDFVQEFKQNEEKGKHCGAQVLDVNTFSGLRLDSSK